jgi:hypothetical protein
MQKRDDCLVNPPICLTGIPRSGTTLCCKLLNQRDDVIALHEPINPSELPHSMSNQSVATYIGAQINRLEKAIQEGLPFPHGDKGGLQIDNPVGETSQFGIRRVVAKRGAIQIAPRPAGSYQLLVKQNALFTALLPELKEHYQMMCIVRNPIDVLLSWLTVDLPINRGHIPAGERFDAKLKSSLVGLNRLQRQLVIYQWFMTTFLDSGLPIVRYEDVIQTNGQMLDDALGLLPINRESLVKQERSFNSATLHTLLSIKTDLLNLQCGGLYSKDDISSALSNIKVS